MFPIFSRVQGCKGGYTGELIELRAPKLVTNSLKCCAYCVHIVQFVDLPNPQGSVTGALFFLTYWVARIFSRCLCLASTLPYQGPVPE